MNELVVYTIIITLLTAAGVLTVVFGWVWFRFVDRYTISPTDAVADLYIRQQREHADD